MSLENTRTISEIIKNAVTVLALIAAGVWAIMHFQETEVSLLELRGFSSSTLTWYDFKTPKNCNGEFRVHIKNIGKKSFDIKNASLRIWLVDYPHTSQAISEINPGKYTTNKPVFERQFTNPQELPLLTHYPPGVEAIYDFTFSFNSDKEIAIFGFIGSGTGQEVTESMWDYLCDPPSKKI